MTKCEIHEVECHYKIQRRIWPMNDLRSTVGDDKLMLKGTHAEVRVLRKYL